MFLALLPIAIKKGEQNMTNPSQYPTEDGECPASTKSREASFFEQLFRARGSVITERPDSSGTTNAPDDEARILAEGSVQAFVVTALPELLEAAELVRERYEWRGYRTCSITEGLVDVDRKVSTLVARQRGLVVGTMTLGLDGPSGLWIEQTYPKELAEARARGRALSELTRLAVTPNSDSRTILSSMFGLAYQIGRLQHRSTDLYIEVNPRHAPVYRKLFGFETASDVRVCGRVKAPAVLLHLDVEHLDACVAQFASFAPAGVTVRSIRGASPALPIEGTDLRAA